MERTCPRCGARFPATATYCDVDGTSLVAPEARPRVRRGRGRLVALALAVLLCLAAGAALPSLVERYIRVRIGVALVEVRYPSTAPDRVSPNPLRELFDRITGLADVLTGSDQISLRLRVRNDSPLTVDLRSATYTVTVDGTPATSGVWTPEPGPNRFAPGDEIVADLAGRPSAAALLAIGRKLIQGKRPEVRASGHLVIEALWTTFEVPFEVEDVRIDLAPGRPPEPTMPDLEDLADEPGVTV